MNETSPVVIFIIPHSALIILDTRLIARLVAVALEGQFN